MSNINKSNEQKNLNLSEKEKTDFLMTSGLMESYEYVLKSLCKAGLPDGNVYEFAALKVLKFEKNFQNEKKRKELLDKYGDKLDKLRNNN